VILTSAGRSFKLLNVPHYGMSRRGSIFLKLLTVYSQVTISRVKKSLCAWSVGPARVWICLVRTHDSPWIVYTHSYTQLVGHLAVVSAMPFRRLVSERRNESDMPQLSFPIAPPSGCKCECRQGIAILCAPFQAQRLEYQCMVRIYLVANCYPLQAQSGIYPLNAGATSLGSCCHAKRL
jgi:hypothetical protein